MRALRILCIISASFTSDALRCGLFRAPPGLAWRSQGFLLYNTAQHNPAGRGQSRGQGAGCSNYFVYPLGKVPPILFISHSCLYTYNNELGLIFCIHILLNCYIRRHQSDNHTRHDFIGADHIIYTGNPKTDNPFWTINWNSYTCNRTFSSLLTTISLNNQLHKYTSQVALPINHIFQQASLISLHRTDTHVSSNQSNHHK